MDNKQETTTLVISPDNLKAKIKRMYGARRSLMTWGAPGAGKSEIHKQAADELNIGFIDLRANLMEPVDLRGIPYLDKDNMTSWATPDIFPIPERHGENGIILVDELPTAMPSVQTSFYQFINDRGIGDYKLPEGWVPMAAGNRTQDHGGTFAMPVPLRNRFAHVELQVNTEEWMDWARKAGISGYITSFINWKNSYLTTPASDATKYNAFPSPRSWKMYNDFLKTDAQLPQYEDVAMFVGAGTGIEFMSFVEHYAKLPKFESIVKDPKKAKLPSDTNVGAMYALSGLIAEKTDKSNIKPVMEYVQRIPIENQVWAVKELMGRDPSLVVHPSMSKWMEKNNAVITG